MRTPEGWFPVNYDRTSAGLTNASHPFQDLTTLSPERETQTVFAHGEYWLSDRTTLFAEALLNRRETIRNGYRQFWNLFHYTEDGDQWLGTGSPLSEGWTGAFILSSTPITDWSGETITVDYTRFVVGAEGYIGDWSWDVNAQTSRSDGDYRTKIIFNDAITPQQGIGAPCAGQPTPVRGVPCVDLPWLDPEFLAGNISQQYRDFLFGEETGNTVYKQHTVEAIFSGELYELPAGMMQAAFGAQYQRDEITDTPGEVTLASNTWGSTSAGITTGSSNTRAVFGELQIPVLYGARFADRLNVELSARHTDVSASGNDTTYKAGFNWDIARGYRIRGSQGTSFRSPALYELYLNDQTSFTRGIDPCVNWENALANGNIPDIVAQNCAADGIPGDYAGAAISTTVRSGGGFGELEAETSLARTLGFVWTPDSVNFGLSIDYFDIEIKGEVTQLSAGQVVMGCYMSENFATEPFCNQFDRDDDFRIDTVRANYQNIASERNRGYDLIASYFHDFDFGRVSVRYNHTYTIEASRQLFETSEREDRAGRLGRPEHVGTLLVGFDRDNWSVNWTTRYVGKSSNHEWYGQGTFRDDASFWGEPVRVVLATPSIFYHSVSGTYDFNSGLRLTAGIANLFDQDPPVLSRSNFTSRVGRSAFYSQYDNLGRRGFIDLSYSF
ncbi:TonB-dependent receptor domain-containing protein [Aliidiomarina sanyensis]|uniref:TonB-dependent receptor domain-containing protein n=1 Tax=Aliidiomarina sanyensis TaxID=1249555 RepID=UPI001F54021F|nr:TonB-dependent receptor [Aliidiomarina sanyensis]